MSKEIEKLVSEIERIKSGKNRVEKWDKLKPKKVKFLIYFIAPILIFTLINSLLILNINSKINTLKTDINDETENKVQEVRPLVQPSQQEPSVITVSADDDAILGNKNAPITIVEFSDFQCPFCTKFYEQTLPLIEENYIKTGKVKFVYRDFPLSFHQYAQKAAEAAECAEEQNKFWEYHNILFEKQAEWSIGGIDKLKEYTQSLGLNSNNFNGCLDSGKYANEVQKDFNDGQRYGVSGTPTFFINGIKLTGAQPFDAFKQVIEQELNK